MMQNVSIVLKPQFLPKFKENLLPIVELLLANKVDVCFLNSEKKQIKNFLKNVHFINEDEKYQTDLIISLSGDGTLLNICRNIKNKAPPIFGINHGTLGFISEFKTSDYIDCLKKCLRNDFETTTIHLFSVKIINKKKIRFKANFINDAVFTRNHISRMFFLKIFSKNDHVYDISGDGLIVSSPIGSTAYSLAAGGPIIHPQVSAIILSPICPHGLTYRPLVLPDTNNIKIMLPKHIDDIILTLDGQKATSILKDDIIMIKRHKNKIIHLIKNPNRTYFNTLKEKLFLSR